MKSFNDIASQVTKTARREPVAEAPPPAPMRHPHACAAAGCPLAGIITARTTGGGPWECRHHFHRPPNTTADEVTTWIRNQLAGGVQPHELGRSIEPSPTVAAMRAALRARPSRQPGEDDE